MVVLSMPTDVLAARKNGMKDNREIEPKLRNFPCEWHRETHPFPTMKIPRSSGCFLSIGRYYFLVQRRLSGDRVLARLHLKFLALDLFLRRE